MVNIEQLTKYNFYENSVDYFNRKHEVKRVYRRKDDKYELIEHPYIEDWSLDERHQLARKISSDQYVTYLAIENDNIIGFVSLKKELVMNKYMILAEMYISRDYRGKGLGKELFGIGKNEAKRSQAKGLYISACSSEETIAFYRAMGAEITDDPIAEMVEAEPYDLQMVCTI